MKTLISVLGLAIIVLSGVSAKADQCPNFYPPNGPFYGGQFAPPARPAQNPAHLKFVSYNVALFADAEGVYRDLSTLPSLKDADFILLQEASGKEGGPTNDVEVLAQRLHMNYVFAPAMTLWGKDYGNAILSRWPLRSVKKVLLPLSDSEKCNQRIALGVVATIGQRMLQVFSVHLSTRFSDSILGGDRMRALQLKPAIEFMNSTRMPAFFSGDLNTFRESGWSHILEMASSVQFIDVHTTQGPTFKKHGFELDHALARGFVHRQDGTETGAVGSDHFPIWSILDLAVYDRHVQ